MRLLRKRKERLLFLSITALGISSIVIQLALMREFLNVFLGNELVFGMILANWLLLTGAGSYLGRHAGHVSRKIELLIVSQLLVAFLPFVSIFLVRALRFWVLLPGEIADLGFVFISSLLILLPYCLISGAMLTLACSVFPGKRSAEQIGKVYFIDNIGDILGGLLFSFILVFFLNSFQMALVVMIVNLIPASLLSGFVNKKILSLSILSLLVFYTTVFLAFDLDRFTTSLMFPGQRILEYRDSPYGRLVVTMTGSQINFFENGLPLFSTGDTIAREETVHYAMIQHPHPKSVLLISGGVSGTLSEILKYNPETVDYVELDPAIIRLGKEYYLVPNGKVRVFNLDGRLFIKNTPRKYDVVIIDLPDPSTAQINRFYTSEFFSELKEALNPGGVVSLGVSSSINYMNPQTKRLNAVVYNTLKRHFFRVIVIPGDENFYIASDSPLTYNIAGKLKERGIHTDYIENYLPGKLTRGRVNYVVTSIEEQPRDINLDFVPLAYYYYSLFWMSEFQASPALVLAVAAAAVALAVLALRRISPVPFAVATSGFAAAGLEVVLLITFQILYGYVYSSIGVIVTSFMFGLAVGAYFMNRKLSRMKRRDMTKILLLISLYSVALPMILVYLSSVPDPAVIFLVSHVLFPVLAVLIAVLIGMEFPLASKLHLALPRRKSCLLYTSPSPRD